MGRGSKKSVWPHGKVEVGPHIGHSALNLHLDGYGIQAQPVGPRHEHGQAAAAAVGRDELHVGVVGVGLQSMAMAGAAGLQK